MIEYYKEQSNRIAPLFLLSAQQLIAVNYSPAL